MGALHSVPGEERHDRPDCAPHPEPAVTSPYTRTGMPSMRQCWFSRCWLATFDSSSSAYVL